MGLHINPLRKKKVYAFNGGSLNGGSFKGGSFNGGTRGNISETDEHMTYREAAIVALVLTLTQIFTSFLALFDWTQVAANPGAFAFNLVKFAGATFFSIFIVLSGMARYMAK